MHYTNFMKRCTHDMGFDEAMWMRFTMNNQHGPNRAKKGAQNAKRRAKSELSRGFCKQSTPSCAPNPAACIPSCPETISGMASAVRGAAPVESKTAASGAVPGPAAEGTSGGGAGDTVVGNKLATDSVDANLTNAAAEQHESDSMNGDVEVDAAGA